MLDRVVPMTRFGRITRPRLVLMGALGGLSLGLWLGLARREDQEEEEQIDRINLSAAEDHRDMAYELRNETRRRVAAEEALENALRPADEVLDEGPQPG